eukprot:scaffold28494_cov46-Tisochrysis_lutea.AAC.1
MSSGGEVCALGVAVRLPRQENSSCGRFALRQWCVPPTSGNPLEWVCASHDRNSSCGRFALGQPFLVSSI